LRLLQREVEMRRVSRWNVELSTIKSWSSQIHSCNDWLEEHVDVEEWPSNSPDLFQLKTWAFIKDELYKVRSKLHTRDDVGREAVQIWYSERDLMMSWGICMIPCLTEFKS